jgi:sodium/bile acid cotransporter 7
MLTNDSTTHEAIPSHEIETDEKSVQVVDGTSETKQPEELTVLLNRIYTNVKTKSVPFFIANFLVIGIAIVLIVSLSFPLPGAYLSSIIIDDVHLISFINIGIVFIISGLTLKTEEAGLMLSNGVAIIYSLIAINFLSTLLAFILRELPFQTPEFAQGLTIFATVPTTLGVGITLTIAAKGDQVLATFLTIASNIIGVATVPALLTLYLSGSTQVNLDPGALTLQLVYNIIIPIFAGVLAQLYIPGVKQLVKTYRQSLSLFSSSNLLCVLWLTLSASQPVIIRQSGLEIFCVLITVTIMHAILLAVNYVIAFRVLYLQLAQAIPVVISVSQKSSPYALAVITSLAPNSDIVGLLILPCILGQVMQIFVGSFVVNHFLSLRKSEDPPAVNV